MTPEMRKNITIDIMSLNAVTIGPEAKAGSTPIRAKKKGEETPSVVAVKEAPKTPAATVTPSCKGLPLNSPIAREVNK